MAHRAPLGVVESAVDDVVQEVFVTVYRRLDQFEGRCALKTWVFGILMRVVNNYRRTRRRKGAGHATSSVVGDPDVVVDAEQIRSSLRAAAKQVASCTSCSKSSTRARRRCSCWPRSRHERARNR